MKKIYMKPEVQTIELSVKRMVMIGASGAKASGLTGTTKSEWDPKEEIDW